MDFKVATLRVAVKLFRCKIGWIERFIARKRLANEVRVSFLLSMKFPLPLGLIVAISLVFHAAILSAQSPLAEKWREAPEPQISDPIARRNIQLPLPTP